MTRPFPQRAASKRPVAHAMLLAAAIVVVAAAPACGQDAPPQEDDYYRIVTLATPEGLVLEVGALQMLGDGRLAVATRRGDVYLIENPHADDPAKVEYKLFAAGLHEVLGLAQRDGWLYVTQRCEVSRLKDVDGDDRADVFETVNDAWGISGDYHEYAFGSKFDRDGNIWVALCLTGSFSSEARYRGWCLRVTPDGRLIPTCSGLRSPGGIGMNAAGDMFYTDNQGPWNGTCGLKHLQPGSFQGHPGGNRWYEAARAHMGPRPGEPRSESRMLIEAERIDELTPTAVFFPYKKMGQSASGIVCDTTGGKFGPFEHQLFVGDQTFSTVMRVFLEKIDGRYQGACFPFVEGFGSGTLALEFSGAGAMFVGGTNRGWGSRGNRPFALERLQWTGKTPFEIHEMRARPDGFELTFTQPVDAQAAGDAASYEMTTYTYIYQSTYGSPEVDQTSPKIERAAVAKDRRSVRLYLDALQPGHVHELHAPGVKSATGLPLLHDQAYYTLNAVPGELDGS